MFISFRTILPVSFLAIYAVVHIEAPPPRVWDAKKIVTMDVPSVAPADAPSEAGDANLFHEYLKHDIAGKMENGKLLLLRHTDECRFLTVQKGYAMAELVEDTIPDKTKFVVYLCGDGDKGKQAAFGAIASKTVFEKVWIVLSDVPNPDHEVLKYTDANREYLDILSEAKASGVKFAFTNNDEIVTLQESFGTDVKILVNADIDDFGDNPGAVIEGIKGYTNKEWVDEKSRKMMNIFVTATDMNVETFSVDGTFLLNAHTGERITHS